MSYLNPEFKITILPFNSREGQSYDLPQEMIGSITSQRSLQGNSISMTIPNGMRNISGLKKFKQVFSDQCIVRLYVRKNPSENFRQLNVGYMNGLSVSLEAMGKLNWSLTFPGLEQKLQKQEMFIDMDISSNDTLNEQSKEASSYEGAFSNIVSALSNTVGMKKLLIGIWDNVIVELMGKYKFSDPIGFTWGGYEILKKWSRNSEISDSLISPFFAEGYHEEATTTYNIFSQNQIGSSPKFWEIITSMATQPLYECFLDTLDTDEKRVVNGLVIDDAILDNSTAENYTVASAGVTSLVFRKTPYDVLFDTRGEWNVDNEFQPINHISNISFSENPDEIYSGVHVGSTEPKLAGKSSSLLFPVRWSDALKRRYGYRVMQIKVDGLTFDYEETATKAKSNYISESLQSIQDRLFDIFLPVAQSSLGTRTYLKNVTTSVNCAFDYFRIGNGLDMGEHELIDFYGRYGYLTGVTDSFNPMGQATSSLQLKWVDNKEDLTPRF